MPLFQPLMRFQQHTPSQKVGLHYSFCITIMSLSWFSIFISINPHSCSTVISSWLGMTSCCIDIFFFSSGWAPAFALTLHITDVFSFKFLSYYYMISDWLLDWIPCFVPYVCGVLDTCDNGHRQACLEEEEKNSPPTVSVGGDLIVTCAVNVTPLNLLGVIDVSLPWNWDGIWTAWF